MITEVCQYTRNWFCRKVYSGNFRISGGIILDSEGTTLPLLSGQYYRILGSVLNDGVHQFSEYGSDELVDEAFTGYIWAMAVPKVFLDLVKEIEDWQEKYGALDSQNMSPFNSESFGGYSYSKGASYSNSGGATNSAWTNTFANRLAPWRKI